MIRPVKIDDLESILDLDRMALSTKWSREHYLTYVNHANAIFNVLIIDGELVGFVLVLQGEEQSDLLQIAVCDSYRTRAFGSKLIESVLDHYSNKHELFLEVDESNLTAIAFYYRLGFDKIGLRKAYYDNGNNALVFRKVI